jgi:hypothetical protein
MSPSDPFMVLGSGQASASDPNLFDPRARATVRYADPAAWITAAAGSRALAAAATGAELSPHDIGFISISDHGTADTMAVVAKAATEGFSSPLRYPAASPGSLAGVPCILFGFRGPTLNFTMTPDQAVPLALRIADAWMNRRVARQVMIATLTTAAETLAADASLVLLGRAALLAPSGKTSTPPPMLIDWLVNGVPMAQGKS